MDVDEGLWFTVGDRCPGRHFVLGNAHTFPGRILAWCPEKSKTFFVSKAEMETTSELTDVWVRGFLSGSEPPPPEEPKARSEWERRVEIFHADGYWPGPGHDVGRTIPMSVLESLHRRFRVAATEGPARESDIETLLAHATRKVPDDYLEIVREATEVEIRVDDGGHIRIWGPLGCLEMAKRMTSTATFPRASRLATTRAGGC